MFDDIVSKIEDHGYEVTRWENSRIGAHSTDDDIEDMVDGIGLAFLVVRGGDAAGSGRSTSSMQRLLVGAGNMQGKMERNRVVLLVEDSVHDLESNVGLSTIPFSANQGDKLLDEILGRIRTVYPGHREPPQASTNGDASVVDPHVRQPILVQAQSAKLKVAWLFLAIVAIVAIIPLSRAFSSSADDETEAESPGPPATTQLSAGVIAGAMSGGSSSQVGGTTATVSPEPAAPNAPGDDDAVAVDRRSPTAPAADPGSSDLLPGSCVLDVSEGVLDAERVLCSGVGGVKIEGPPGPWHNVIDAVALDDGVIGSLDFELRSNGTTDGPPTIDLVPGSNELNAADSRFGVDVVRLWFSADNQHAHLIRRNGDVLEELTLTFLLDL